jgi:hypothetical protein
MRKNYLQKFTSVPDRHFANPRSANWKGDIPVTRSRSEGAGMSPFRSRACRAPENPGGLSRRRFSNPWPALIIALLLILPTMVRAQDYSFVTFNNQITIVRYVGTGGAVLIPDFLFGVPVTRIQTEAFARCTNVTSIRIPRYVANIEPRMAYECSSLTNIAVDPANDTYSSVDGVLFNKDQTTLVEYPDGRAGSYIIPNSVNIIGNEAFSGRTSLTSIVIGNSVTVIGNDAFNGCSSLTSITIPDSVTRIGVQAFNGCSGLTNVTLGNSVTTIGAGAFQQCSGLTSVKIPDSVTNVESVAFFRCEGLTSITIGNGVTTIGDSAFYGSSSLTRVYFKGNPPIPGQDMFQNSNNPRVYYLPGTTGWTNSYAGLTTVLWAPKARTTGTSFGVVNDKFGFIIESQSNDLVVLVEDSADLENPVWSQLTTVTLAAGVAEFRDPDLAADYPRQFYRFQMP